MLYRLITTIFSHSIELQSTWICFFCVFCDNNNNQYKYRTELIAKCQKQQNKTQTKKEETKKNFFFQAKIKITTRTTNRNIVYLHWMAIFIVELGNDNEEILIFFKLSAWQLNEIKEKKKQKKKFIHETFWIKFKTIQKQLLTQS